MTEGGNERTGEESKRTKGRTVRTGKPNERTGGRTVQTGEANKWESDEWEKQAKEDEEVKE